MPVVTEKGPVVASRKIRIFPKDEKKYLDFLSLSRRAYNLAIEWLKSQKRVDLDKKTEVRRRIREQVHQEFEDRNFSSDLSDLSVDEAFETFTKCIKKWTKGQKAQLHFRSRRDVSKTFKIRRLPQTGIYPRTLGDVHITEEIPCEALNSMATVTRRHGRWYLQVKKLITVRTRENQARTVALDPGVRTFMTAFSVSEVCKYGEEFASTYVFPLLRKKDTLFGRRQRLLNVRTDEQWWKDRMRCVCKRLDRLSAGIEDRIEDLHRRIAFELVINYDNVVCPPFETTQMVAKEGRKLRRSSVREMLTLGHYRFQQHLKWMCRKYGVTFIACCEAYTSKTRSWDGVVHQELGGAATISDGKIVVERDINGARGIFLRAHTGQLTP